MKLSWFDKKFLEKLDKKFESSISRQFMIEKFKELLIDDNDIKEKYWELILKIHLNEIVENLEPKDKLTFEEFFKRVDLYNKFFFPGDEFEKEYQELRKEYQELRTEFSREFYSKLIESVENIINENILK